MDQAQEITVRVLGPLAIEIDGVAVAFPGKLKHRLIARLALDPGVPVSTDELPDALWGESPPRTAKQSLHVHVSHIRDRLRLVGAERLVHTTPDSRYMLASTGVVTDAIRFEAMVDQGVAARLAGNLRNASDKLREAVDLWGEPYESLANDYQAMAERHRLVAVYERGFDAYTSTLVDLGETDAAIPLLRSTLATMPLREQPYEQLMEVYIAAGEPALAASVFEQASQTFDTELGISPSMNLLSLSSGLGGSQPMPAEPVRNATLNGGPVDIETSGLLRTPTNADTSLFVDSIRAQATPASRRVAHGRVVPSSGSPLSPVAELAGFYGEPGTSRSPQLQSQLFDRISHRLVQNFFLAPVLVLEGVEHASTVLIDYLTHAMTRSGPAPFTLIILSSECLDGRLPPALVDVLPQLGSLDLPQVRAVNLDRSNLDDAERSVLTLVSCATLPVVTEIIARASQLAPINVAAVVERLVARGITIIEPTAGRLGLRDPQGTIGALGLSEAERTTAHLALAAAIAHTHSLDGPHRTIARTRHLLKAMPGADWNDAAASLRESVEHLESLGAYRDIVELCTHSDPNEWPDEHITLDLLVALGRAFIRSGQGDEARPVLARSLAMARLLGDGAGFGETVRAMGEERAPQTHDDTHRACCTRHWHCSTRHRRRLECSCSLIWRTVRTSVTLMRPSDGLTKHSISREVANQQPWPVRSPAPFKQSCCRITPAIAWTWPSRRSTGPVRPTRSRPTYWRSPMKRTR